MLKGLFAVTDRSRFKFQNYGDLNLQNAYYEGYTQSKEVANLFVFKFFGEIILAGVNHPGSWHDKKLAGTTGLYFPKLSASIKPSSMAILGDSAFVNGTDCTNGKFLRARKRNETDGIIQSGELSAIDLIIMRVMPNERQSAKWAIRAIKVPFQRLNTVLMCDTQKTGISIELACRLLNFRTKRMGRSQIPTT